MIMIMIMREAVRVWRVMHILGISVRSFNQAASLELLKKKKWSLFFFKWSLNKKRIDKFLF